MKSNEYLFKSERLGFRNWTEQDKPKMAIINSDPKVMEFFPGILNNEQTEQFVDRMKKQFSENGFCYFAVDKLDNNQFIGFIGIAKQDFKSDFTPCVDRVEVSTKRMGKRICNRRSKKMSQLCF